MGKSTTEETAAPFHALHNPHTTMKPGDESKTSPVEHVRYMIRIINIHLSYPEMYSGCPLMPTELIMRGTREQLNTPLHDLGGPLS